MERKRGMKTELSGTVVSNKMEKTVVIMVEHLVKHPMYHKYIRRRAKYAAHDENNTCQIGDKVLITGCRPISKTKKWRVSNILEKAV